MRLQQLRCRSGAADHPAGSLATCTLDCCTAALLDCPYHHLHGFTCMICGHARALGSRSDVQNRHPTAGIIAAAAILLPSRLRQPGAHPQANPSAGTSWGSYHRIVGSIVLF